MVSATTVGLEHKVHDLIQEPGCTLNLGSGTSAARGEGTPSSPAHNVPFSQGPGAAGLGSLHASEEAPPDQRTVPADGPSEIKIRRAQPAPAGEHGFSKDSLAGLNANRDSLFQSIGSGWCRRGKTFHPLSLVQGFVKAQNLTSSASSCSACATGSNSWESDRSGGLCSWFQSFHCSSWV